MQLSFGRGSLSLFAMAALVLIPVFATAQSTGNSGTVQITVVDPTGAIVQGATVTMQNPVSQYTKTQVTDQNGFAVFHDVPFNPYHTTASAKGFNTAVQDIDVRSIVPVNTKLTLPVAATEQTVEVTGAADLLETEPTFHTDVDRQLIDKLPLESASSSVSSLVTLSSPGVAADSNGLFHGLGDHAENSFSVDGQPITDQQSKVFSNQIPLDSIQDTEVISGAPPAEFGDKTSLVIKVSTRSGQGETTPHGSVSASYGTFGTSTEDFNLGYGGKNWGEFVSVSGLDTGRFLDPPEFQVLHAQGNEENFWDRIDLQPTGPDSVHLDLGFTRSWFQQPNAFDNFHFGLIDPFGNPIPPTDQRAQIKTFNIAPSWTHLISNTTVFTLGAFVRHDQFNFYPSADPLADLSSIESETVIQGRRLTNAGIRSDVNYVKGINNIKVGVVYQHWFLDENDSLGIVDPNLLPSLGCPNGNPAPDPCAVLPPFDLTRGGHFFNFRGHTDVKETSLYLQDGITKGNWTINAGIRGDIYNGFVSHNEAEPRLGLAYNIKKTNTVLRASYARVLETPFNENLIVSSEGCANAVLNPLLGCNAPNATPLPPGWRNEFHLGLEQAIGKYVVASGEWIDKYTHNAYDFSILGNTPVTFPIAWDRSKIPGYAARVNVPNFHGFSALTVMSSVSARFFTPQLGGAGATPGAPSGVFRIDHDEAFNESTHLQYQLPWKRSPWLGFNWRYDSGLVVSGVPDAGAALGLTPFQQVTLGLACNGVFATVSAPLTNCINPNGSEGLVTSNFITLPQGGYGNFPSQENDDHNPDRVKPRHLFDLAAGDDNLFGGDRYKWSLRLTAINIADTKALYNFLSTFSGTHFVTPRAFTAELGFHF